MIIKFIFDVMSVNENALIGQLFGISWKIENP
jgi:hypothetical protein